MNAKKVRARLRRLATLVDGLAEVLEKYAESDGDERVIAALGLAHEIGDQLRELRRRLKKDAKATAAA